jgi:hypothetical protein
MPGAVARPLDERAGRADARADMAVKAEIRKTIKKDDGDTVTVRLEARRA